MNKIDCDAIFGQIKEIWPNFSGTSVQYGMCWSWFRDHDVSEITKIITSIDVSGSDFFPKEKIAAKIKELRRNKSNKSGQSTRFPYKDLYLVCTESDGKHPFIYPGRVVESVIKESFSDEEILYAMQRQAEHLCMRYGYARYQNFIGIENRPSAYELAEKLKKQSFDAGTLPDRLYVRKSFLGVKYETQPGEVKETTQLKEYDPDNPDDIPF